MVGRGALVRLPREALLVALVATACTVNAPEHSVATSPSPTSVSQQSGPSAPRAPTRPVPSGGSAATQPSKSTAQSIDTCPEPTELSGPQPRLRIVRGFRDLYSALMEHTIYPEAQLSEAEAKRTVCKAIDGGFHYAMDVLGGGSAPKRAGPSRCTEPGPHWFDLFRSNTPYIERVMVLQITPGTFLKTVQERHALMGQLGPDTSLALREDVATLLVVKPHWTCVDNPADECFPQYNPQDTWLCAGSEDTSRPCDIDH